MKNADKEIKTPVVNTSDLLSLANEVSYRRTKSLTLVLEHLEINFEMGEVLSTDFDDTKREINTFVEHAFKALIVEKFYYTRQVPEAIDYNVGYLYEARLIKSMGKKLAKLSEEDRNSPAGIAIAQFLERVAVLGDVVEWMKAHKVSARAKKQAATAEKKDAAESYMKKYVAHRDVQKVIAMLTEITAEKRDEIFNNELSFLKALGNKIVEAANREGSTRRKLYDEFYNNPMMSFLLSRVIDGDGKVVSDWVEYVTKMAQEAADSLIDGFIYKNTGKIAYIIYKKNNMESIKYSNMNIGRGKIECDLHVKFNDGSKFIATSSVVGSVSSLGKWFYRYPTTFHEVYLPNGEKMAMPSEQKMEEIFAVS